MALCINCDVAGYLPEKTMRCWIDTALYQNSPVSHNSSSVSHQINAIALCGSAFFASCADDGSLRVWSVKEREQTLQFQVMNQVSVLVS